jgi:ArsR family transcriptional regulator, lead/cadmium/zinc/bismuth-responsive transcriptional repressor
VDPARADRGTAGERSGALRTADVAHARDVLKERATYQELAQIFDALSDPTRASIVHVLSRQELCAADLAFTLGLRRPATSQHLRQLRQMRIVRSRREGRLVIYSLHDDHVAELVDRGLAHVTEDAR